MDSSTGLGNRPVIVKTPVWSGGFRASCRSSGTHVLAHGFAQLTFEGRIGCGERLGQIAQIVRLTELVAAVGQGCGYSRHQTCLLVAEHGQTGHSRCFRGRGRP